LCTSHTRPRSRWSPLRSRRTRHHCWRAPVLQGTARMLSGPLWAPRPDRTARTASRQRSGSARSRRPRKSWSLARAPLRQRTARMPTCSLPVQAPLHKPRTRRRWSLGWTHHCMRHTRLHCQTAPPRQRTPGSDSHFPPSLCSNFSWQPKRIVTARSAPTGTRRALSTEQRNGTTHQDLLSKNLT
jgi:hypothetical protein